MPKKGAAPFILSEALLAAFDTNDRINQYLVDNLPFEAWRAEPPGKKGRDVAGAYLIAHDAHHRGQIAMLARQTGQPIPQKAMFGMWEWGVR